MSGGRLVKKGSWSVYAVSMIILGVLLVATAAPGFAVKGDILWEGISDDMPGWQVIAGFWQVDDGVLRGRSGQGGIGRAFFGKPEWQNVTFEADVTFLEVNNNSRWAALIYRARQTHDYWLMTVRRGADASNGVEIAQRVPAGGSGTWRVHQMTAWQETLELGTSYRFRVAVFEDQVMIYINDQLLLQEQGVHAGGLLGFHTDGATVEFRNALVRSLDEAGWDALVQEQREQMQNIVLEKRPLAIAHRGASSVAPENTIAAVEKAIEIGSEWVEIDIFATLDRELVVLHDRTVDRTTDGTGHISELRLEEVERLDAGSWFGQEFAGEPLPTLREVLEVTRDRAILLIEMKPAGLEAATVDLVRELGMEDQVAIQSFNHSSIATVKRLAPEIPGIILINRPEHSDDRERAAEWMVQRARTFGADAVAVQYAHVTHELVSLAREAGLQVYPWTVNSRSGLLTMMQMNVDGIITDYPQTLKELLSFVSYTEAQ